MEILLDAIFYVLVFLSVYSQIFFLVTFFENKSKIVKTKTKILSKDCPTVTIIVPCWNEEKTVTKTVLSLLDLNYPKDKLSILVVDDGSTDKTWEVISQFSKFPNVKIIKKENGGKHTALNLGISISQSEFIGCLDADSEAEKNSLIKLITYFNKDKELMAVSPSILVKNAKTIIQKAQIAEYQMSVYLKKMLGFVGGIHVTPGPLTIFKREVFERIGEYRHAHSTEDMEIAYRMQTNHMKIDQCHDAYVYTNTPNTVKKLFKQRVRWTYGFLNNTIDYRSFLFKKQYGSFSLFTVPFSLVSAITVVYLILKAGHSFVLAIQKEILYYRAIGLSFDFDFNFGSFDVFYLNMSLVFFVTILLYFLITFSVYLGTKMSSDEGFSVKNFLYFLVIFSTIAPFWLLKALYNTAVSKKPSWR